MLVSLIFLLPSFLRSPLAVESGLCRVGLLAGGCQPACSLQLLVGWGVAGGAAFLPGPSAANLSVQCGVCSRDCELMTRPSH